MYNPLKNGGDNIRKIGPLKNSEGSHREESIEEWGPTNGFFAFVVSCTTNGKRNKSFAGTILITFY